MINTETLGIGIDPTLAQSGGAKFEQILNQLVAAADRMTTAVDRMAANAGAGATKAATSVGQIATAADRGTSSIERMASTGQSNLSRLEQSTAAIGREMANLQKIAAQPWQAAGAGEWIKQTETGIRRIVDATVQVSAANNQAAASNTQATSSWDRLAAATGKNVEQLRAQGTAAIEAAKGASVGRQAVWDHAKAQEYATTVMQKLKREHENAVPALLSFAQRMRGTQTILYEFSSFMGPAATRLIGLANGFGMAARATEQLNNSGKLAETGMAGLLTRVAPIAGVLLALVAALSAAAIAFHLFHDALKEGQELETSRANLTALTGSMHGATEAYEGFVEIARHTRFEIPELEKTYTGLFKFRREGENVNQTLKDLATLAAGPGGNLNALASALEQVERTGKVTMDTINLFGGRGGGGVDIVALLATSMHKTSQQVLEDIKNQQIGTREVQRALHEAAAEGGYFARIMDSLSATSAQAFKRLHTDWTEVKANFGAPIDAALAPLLDELDKHLRELIPVAAQWGEAVGKGIRVVTLAIKDNKGPELFKLMFQVGTDEAIAYIKKAFLDLFKWFATLPWNTIKDLFKGATIPDDILQGGDPYSLGGNSTTAPGAPAQNWEQNEAAVRAKRLRDMINTYLGQMSKEEQAKEIAPPPGSPIVTTPKNEFAGRTQVQTDADIMRDYNDQLAQLKAHLDAGSVSQREFNTRLREMQESTAKELANPGKYAAALGAWNAYENERLKKAAETEARLKSGDASVTEAFMYGLQKQAQAYGTFASQVAQLAQDMTNSFATGLSTAIGDVITGTKDAKTAFKDFAVSVLNDISRMIIKMLILKAVQAAIGYAGSSGGGDTGGGFRGGMAAGGPIFGGSGTHDDVPIMAMAGEFMIRKDMVRQHGIENLYALNQGRAAIVKRYEEGGEIEPPILPGTAGYMPNLYNSDMPRSINRGGGAGGYEAVSRHLFADDTYSPRPYSPGREFPGDYGFNPRTSPTPTPTPTPTHPPFTDNTGLIGNDYGYRPYPTTSFGNLPVNFGNIVPDYSGQRPDPAVLTGTPPIGYTNLNTGTGQLVMWNGTDWTNMGPVPTPGLVPDPTRNYVGFMDPSTGMHLNVTGYDQNTGTTFYQDDHGNSYATGPNSPRETQPGGGQGTGSPGGAAAVTPYSNFGGVVSGQRSTIGNAAFDSHAAGLMMMAFQAFGGNPNNTGTTTDAGHTIFQAGGQWHGHAEDGVVTHVPGGFGIGTRDKRWVFPSQSVSWAGGFSYADAKHVKAHNDWLIAHNQWYYGPGGVLEQQRASAANMPQPAPPMDIMPPTGGALGPVDLGPPGYATGGLILPAGAFMYAQRMHNGGTVGMTHDEVPIVAKRGEKVVTPEQWANVAPSQNTTNVFNISTTIQSNGATRTETSGTGGAGADDTARAVNRKIQAAITEEISPGGSIYNFVKSAK